MKWSNEFTSSSDFAITHAIFQYVRDQVLAASNPNGSRTSTPFYQKGLSDLNFSTDEVRSTAPSYTRTLTPTHNGATDTSIVPHDHNLSFAEL